MIRTLLLVVTMALASLPHAAAQDAPAQVPPSQPRKPNIIFILADDLGWADVGCYGSTYYETPNIDRLASQGMRFTSGYSAGPNCTPTRAAIMSGQYGARTGIFTVGSIDRFDWRSRPLAPPENLQNLPLNLRIVPQPLKDAGYVTGMFGKWHLGQKGEFHPSQRGFDEAVATAGKHFDFKTDPAVEHPQGQYLADFLTDRSVDFIQRNKDKPLFLYLPHFGVHTPRQAKPGLIEKFKAKPGVGGHNDPVYAAMLYSVDESLGRIMATLDELKLADDTLVIFSSDNGGVGGYQREGIEKGNDITDNAPLRGGKGMLYEGGIRVPFIFRFPGKIKAGVTSDAPIISVDLLPSFVELARAKSPDQPLDGVSLVSHLHGKPLEREDIFWHFPGYLGAPGDDAWRTKPVGVIRSGDYKLLEWYEDGTVELYNLKTDIGEKHNLAQKQPELAKSLRAKLVSWREETGARMPAKQDPQKSQAGGKRQRQRRAADGEDE
ncbi:MAG TPA: sulfatase [Tepidisphaeraceae bacterium]|nr:sulfatase [Tepidisphaeraceae bacterium]